MKIILDGKLVPCVTRADMEKYHPNLMRALDNIAKADSLKVGSKEVNQDA